MNNLLKIIFCLFVICDINATFSFAADKLSLQEMRVKINKIFQDLEEDDINLSPVEGWYTLKKGMVIAYISEDGRYLFQGNLYSWTHKRTYRFLFSRSKNSFYR